VVSAQTLDTSQLQTVTHKTIDKHTEARNINVRAWHYIVNLYYKDCRV